MPHSTDPGAPFEIPGDRGGVLCLHGFSNTPYEMRPVGLALAEAGYHVHAPLAAGHGQTPQALAHTGWTDWLQGARRAFDALAARHDRVAIVGLSMGGLLGLTLAHERGERVAGVCAMAVPLEFDWATQRFLRVVRRLPFADALPLWGKGPGPDISDAAAAAAAPGYDKVPLCAAAELLRGQAAVRACAPRIGVPVLVQHGRHDHVAPVQQAHALVRLLETPRRRLVIYPRSWHILPLDVEHEAVVADTLAFVESLFAPRPKEPA